MSLNRMRSSSWTATFSQGRLGLTAAIVLTLLAGAAQAAEVVSHPFVGVTHIARTEQSPRPVRMHVVVVELRAPGIRCLVTPPKGELETVKQTTFQFLTEQKAQIAINAHFFEPWPAPSPDPGTADLVGLAASNGHVFSPFNGNPPKQYAIRPNAPALNIDQENNASIVHRNTSDPTGNTVAEPVRLFNVVSGNEQILAGGQVTAGTGQWDNTPNPLTIIGLAPGGRLIVLVVDGRQPGTSEGLSTREAADLAHRDYGVTDAINLDGGGSATLCLADPEPRVVNVPVGKKDVPGTLRPVGSSLAIFARALSAETPVASSRPVLGESATTQAADHDGRGRIWPLALGGSAAGVLVALVVWVVRRRRSLGETHNHAMGEATKEKL